METTPVAEPEGTASTDTAGSRGRLSWTVETRGHLHRLDLMPGVFGGSVSVLLDGRRIARVGKPDAVRPWREAQIVVDGEPVTIGLVARGVITEFDVFMADRSLFDGRSIAAARAAAPIALTQFQVVFGVAPRARQSLLTLNLGLGGVVALGAIVVAGLLSPTKNVAVVAALFGGFCYLFLVLMRSWGVVADRVHAYALGRQDLSARAQIFMVLGAFFGYMVLSTAAFIGLELLLFVTIRFVQDALPG